MDTIRFSAVRANLAKTMEKVCDEHSPITITRKDEPSVVLISLEDYEAMQETLYLMSTPVNAVSLLDAINELES
ncbi:MAG: type II toxin-antitoxin system Phd/YefM family antitoxin [Marinomonas sp.]